MEDPISDFSKWSVSGPFAGVSAGFAGDGSFFPVAGQPLFPGPYPV